MTSLTPPGLKGQMLTHVHEESFLSEIVGAVTEHVGSGTTIVQGPWRADDCRSVLLRWFDEGWLDCVAVASTHTVGNPDDIHHYAYDAEWQMRATLDAAGSWWVLSRNDARQLIANPESWTQEGPGAGVCVCRTNATDQMSYEDWMVPIADIDEGVPDG